ncbi:MAG: Ni/Fe hydrogenase subunit alpha [Kouleothrix sp.]|nr:Ni/Fe hydrogenase subunit alpha [Kouleothrix sp.]
MSRQILIDPVTRIEGHAKITIHLDEAGYADDARLHITQFRGFEKLCVGRPFTEMPALMARTCGICPVSHLIAAAKACDAILAVRVPAAAIKLRRVLNLAQIIQSHALSFFYLSSPDLLFGMDSDPARRNFAGVLEAAPELARDGIRLRQFGQQTIELLGGKRIHPAWVVAGGVSAPLDVSARDTILARIPAMLAAARHSLVWFHRILDQHQESIRTFANFPSMYMALARRDESGEVLPDWYDGDLRFVDSDGSVVVDAVAPDRYAEYIGEAVEPWSYMKFPYFRPAGYPAGIYRVGPLARLNIAGRSGTPLADEEWLSFRALRPGAVHNTFYYHYARLIEILAAIEHIERLLRDPEILDRHVRAITGPNSAEGVGVAEAPRGTLLHHYRIDQNGLVTWSNLIIATGHNNLAMNRGISQVARAVVDGARLTEGALNRVEAVIRAFDPCLSCATHADGTMALQLQLIGPDGAVLDEARR